MNRPALERAAATPRDAHQIDKSELETVDGRMRPPRNHLAFAPNRPAFKSVMGTLSISHRLLLASLALALSLAAVVGTSTPSASADEPENFAPFDADAMGEDIGWRNAYLLSLLDYFVYDGVIPGATGDAFAAKFEEYFTPLGLSNFTYINTPWWATDTQAMVVETDDAIIVAFRGTQQLADIAVDADLGPYTPEGIHRGFSAAADSALPAVSAAIAAAPGKKIWLTGHSLGGAVAQATAYKLAAARMIDPDVPAVQGVVTFGSPRVFRTIGFAGPVYWANYGDFKSERWVNNNDPVPHTPWPVEFYHQSKWTRIVVAANGACSLEVREIVGFWPDVADHDVPRYASRIYYMMPAELRTGLPLPPVPAEPVADCDQAPGSTGSQLIDLNALDDVVNEGAPNGTPVGITAAPPTSAIEGLTYSLWSNADGRFAIDPSTGVVTVANGSLLDFESATAHTIGVLASKEGVALVGFFRIYVANVPGAPVDIDTAADQVYEGAAAGTAVGITASSPGEGGSTSTYSLANNAGGRFAINASSGVVTVANGALLDGPETHYIRVVADHSGEASYAQTFAVSVLNANPTATITSLNGGVSDVGFLGVPVSFGGSFSDSGALDTHTATLNWGDGAASETFGGGNVSSPLAATHTYQAAGQYTVSLTVQDDDGGTHTLTRAIQVYDGVGGVSAVSTTLEGLLETETNPEVLAALGQALVELEGNDGGASTNGAVDLLAGGDLVAALVKMEEAVELLTQAGAAGADTSDLTLMLALGARITAEKAQAEAIAAIGPSPSRGQQKQLSSIETSVVAGRAAIGTGDYISAIENFTAAVQRALLLIG